MKLRRLETNSMEWKKLRRTPWDRKLLGQQGKIDAYFKAAARFFSRLAGSLAQLYLRTFFRNSGSCDVISSLRGFNNLAVYLFSFLYFLFHLFIYFFQKRDHVGDHRGRFVREGCPVLRRAW